MLYFYAFKVLPMFYFGFENDFVEDNIRCIPMIVRIKLDAVRIKLKLSEWVKFSNQERLSLAQMPCDNDETIAAYHRFLSEIIKKHTQQEATFLSDEKLDLSWQNLEQLPTPIQKSAMEHRCNLTIKKWQQLTDLQRFALVKLSTSSHESHNFVHALGEFGLL
jgi:hypothetical protein